MQGVFNLMQILIKLHVSLDRGRNASKSNSLLASQSIPVDVPGVLVDDVVHLVVREVDADVDDELLHVLDVVVSLQGQSGQALHE
jgi:hypothetical protein